MNDLVLSLNRALSLAAQLNRTSEEIEDDRVRDMVEDIHHELCRAKFNLSGVMGENHSLRKRLNGEGKRDTCRAEPILFNGCIDM